MKTINKEGGTETIKIRGNPGASFDVKISNEDGLTYDFSTGLFDSTVSKLRNQIIDKSGVLNLKVRIPAVSDNDKYDVVIDARGKTRKGSSLQDEVALSILQYGDYPTMLFDVSSGGAVFTPHSDLTGGVSVVGTPGDIVNKSWTNSGTVVKGSDIIYTTQSNLLFDEGGAAADNDFTNVFRIEKTIEGDGVGTKFKLNNTTNLATGMYVEGEGVRGDVTISSISSGVVTLSSSHSFGYGDKLVFTNGKWIHETISGTISGSGTNSLTLTLNGQVQRIGVADITAMLDVDDIVSRDPNAFALRMNAARGTEVAVNVVTPDTDANSAAKTYKLHSAPASGEGTITQTNGDAISSGDTITDGSLTYNVPSGVDDVGQTYTFVYKNTDAAGRNSSTSTGVISITVTVSETTATELND